MQTKLIIAALATTGFLGACAQIPQPLCDREAQEWNKFDTQEDVCATTATVRAPTAPRVIKRTPTGPEPETPVSGPEDEPEPDTPEEPEVDEPEGNGNDKPNSDNSDANGKGGNKHDREDKTDHGTEAAEDKKD